MMKSRKNIKNKDIQLFVDWRLYHQKHQNMMSLKMYKLKLFIRIIMCTDYKINKVSTKKYK